MRKFITFIAGVIIGIAITLPVIYAPAAQPEATGDVCGLPSAMEVPTSMHQAALEALRQERDAAKSEATVSRSAMDRMRRERADAEAAVMRPVPPDYRQAMYRAAQEFDIPLSLLVALCIQETDCKPGKVGQHGELGLLQVMPSTGAAVAAEMGLAEYDLAGADGIRIGAAFLREGIDAEGGNLAKGLAYYNGGNGWRGKPDAMAYAGAVLAKAASGN